MFRNFMTIVFVALLCAGLAAPLAAEDMWLMATAEGQGLEGTHWTGPGCFLNPSDEPGEATLTYFPWGQDNSTVTVPPYTLILGPGEEFCVDNVFSLFDVTSPGQGSVHVASDGSIYVVTRMQTENPDGAGSYGQYIEGVPNEDVLPANTPVFLAGLADNQSFRSNVGMLNVSSTTNIGLTIELYDDMANLLGVDAHLLRPREGRQLTRILGPSYFDVAPIDGAYLKITSTGEFLVYLSKVDTAGDPTYAPGRMAPDNEEIFVPAAALADGEAGTRWYTAFDALNTTDSPVTLGIEYWPRSHPATNPDTRTLSVLPGHQFSSANVIEDVFGLTEGAAAFRITASGPGVHINTRTYNMAPGDNKTFGQFIPGVPSSAALSPGFKGTLALVSEVDGQWRTNLITLNTGDSPVRILGRLMAMNGDMVGQTYLDVPALTYDQIGHVTDRFVTAPFEQGYIEFFIVDGEGPVFLLGSKVEYHTGDPIAEMIKLSRADNPFAEISQYMVDPSFCNFGGCEIAHSWEIRKADTAAITCDDDFRYDIPATDLDAGMVTHIHTISTSCTLTAANAHGQVSTAPVSITVGACNEAVFLEGTLTPESGVAPLEIVASATFQYADTIEYSFDSGVNWTTSNTHTFNEAGAYPVITRALYCLGEVTTIQIIGTVVVSEPCDPPLYQDDGLVTPTSGIVSETVFNGSATFTGQAESVEWSWGDGSGWTTASTHLYSLPGTYDITVRAMGCGEIVGPYSVETVIVEEPCDPPVFLGGRVNPDSGTVNTTFAATSDWTGGVDDLEYDFGDDSGWSTVTTHQYDAGGRYTVRVRAHGCGGDTWGPYKVGTATVTDP